MDWVTIPFSRVSSWPRDWTWVSCIAGRCFYCLSHQGSPGVMVNSSKSTYASVPHLLGLLLLVFLTPWQATVDSCLCWRLPNTLTQVWLSLLWDNCSFLLRAGAYRFCLCSPRVSVSPVLWKSVIKSRWRLTADSLVSLLVPHVGKFVLGPRTFSTVQELLWYNFSPVCGCIIQM